MAAQIKLLALAASSSKIPRGSSRGVTTLASIVDVHDAGGGRTGDGGRILSNCSFTGSGGSGVAAAVIAGGGEKLDTGGETVFVETRLALVGFSLHFSMSSGRARFFMLGSRALILF